MSSGTPVRLRFLLTAGRTDHVLSIGCATFISAALILIVPRIGMVAVEILAGMFCIGWALVTRIRRKNFSARVSGPADELMENAERAWFDRYDALLFAGAIGIRVFFAGVLHRAGWSQSSIGVLPLVLFAVGIILKRRFVSSASKKTKSREVDEVCR